MNIEEELTLLIQNREDENYRILFVLNNAGTERESDMIKVIRLYNKQNCFLTDTGVKKCFGKFEWKCHDCEARCAKAIMNNVNKVFREVANKIC